MRHFNYFPNGGPFPGVCAMCGIDRDLWMLGFEHFRGGDAMACSRCIGELAENINYAPRTPLEETIKEMGDQLDALSEKLNRIPNHTEGLINAIRNSLTDFVFAVSNSGNTNSNPPIQNSDRTIDPVVESKQPADVSRETYQQPVSQQGSIDFPAAHSRNKPGRPRKG